MPRKQGLYLSSNRWTALTLAQRGNGSHFTQYILFGPMRRERKKKEHVACINLRFMGMGPSGAETRVEKPGCMLQVLGKIVFNITSKSVPIEEQAKLEMSSMQT